MCRCVPHGSSVVGLTGSGGWWHRPTRDACHCGPLPQITTEGGESKIQLCLVTCAQPGKFWQLVSSPSSVRAVVPYASQKTQQASIRPVRLPKHCARYNSSIMSSEKRSAAEDPTPGQLVKRQNVGSSRALTRLGGPASGALIQAVRRISVGPSGFMLTYCVGASHKWS